MGREERLRKRGRGAQPKRTASSIADKRHLDLVQEIRHIQTLAAKFDSRIVTIGELLLFSSQSGDAWLLDTADQLATKVAEDGDPLPVALRDMEDSVSVNWAGHFRIEGQLFTYIDIDTSKITQIIGYPVDHILRQIK